ncbi:MAG: LacI family DNA-binding transcriptional regulator [Bacillota bacterium]|nr:LacI family DNA-binding transcriptional regulator [Bacillota bacterium]
MATIKDIAKLADVSAATVSRVLNYDLTLSVPDKTREKVFMAAEELNYDKYKKNKKEIVKRNEELVIGISEWYSPTEELSDPYYLSIRSGIEKACYENKIKTVTIFKDSDGIHINKLADVDAIVAIGKYSDIEVKEFAKISSNLVFVDCSPNDKLFDSVVIDFRKAVRNVLDYFISLGHVNIAYIGGKEYVGRNANEISDPREEYFKKYLIEKGIYNEKYIRTGVFSVEDGYNLAYKLVNEEKITAIFVASDSMAVGVIRAIYDLGIKIPKEISVIGFDDIPTAEYLIPPLTTVRVYTEYMGRVAVERVISKKDSLRRIPQKTVIPTELIKRKSVAKI